MNLGIDIYKHILAVFVIILHMTSSRYSESFLIELRDIQTLVDGAVAGFFLISGYYFYKEVSFKSLMLKKLKRLILPYFIFSIIYTFILVLLEKGDFLTGIINTISFHGGSMQLYFLPYLFIVIIIYWIYFKFISNYYTNILFVLLLVFFCYFFPVLGSSGSNYLQIPFYMLAFLVGVFYKQLTLNKFKNSIYLASLLIFLIIFGIKDSRFYDLGFILLLFHMFLVFGELLPKYRLPGSGAIYLLHTPILNFFFSVLLQKFGIKDFNNFILSVLFTYIFSLLLVYLLFKYLKRYKWIILE